MSITGVAKTEGTYRAVMLDSSSSLKDFATDRKKYYKKYILNEPVKEDDSQAATMGRIVETQLMEPEEVEERFYLSSCASAPTGLMLSFVEGLYREARDATDERGVINKSFLDISMEAYKASGFKISYEAVITKFMGSDAQLYYEEIRKVRSKNLTVVTAQDLAKGEQIVNELKNNSVTKKIVSLVDSQRYTILDQYQIEDYEVDGHRFKSMLDKVIVDHEEKTISIYDLKCVWAVEGFYDEYYLYRKAYIQAFLYYQAMLSVANDKTGPYYGYLVKYPEFVVCDSTNYFNPLIYTLNANDMMDAYNGFEHKGRKYTGVKDLIKDLSWALETNIWNISRVNYENNGIVNIKGN